MQSPDEVPPQTRATPVASTDQERFLSLIDLHERLLMKVCWVYTRTSHDRDDLLQEMIARLWAAFGSYDHSRTFSTWMYRVALNVAIDFRRRRHKQAVETWSLEEAPDAACHQDGSKAEQLQELRELLETLNEADRAILLLCLEGHSYRDIADVMGISESNVGTRLNRLKKSLRSSIESSNQS